MHDLQHGADIGFTGNRHTTVISNNHPSCLEHATALDDDIATNLQEGVTIGPFTSNSIPFSHFRCSPLGVLVKPKPNGPPKVRRIHDLSFPRHQSVNLHIPADYVAVSYPRLRDILDSVAALGPGAHLSVADVKSAFKHVPVSPADVPLLGFQWRGKYYFEVTLPFGLRSAPGLYDSLGAAVEWIMNQNSGAHLTTRFVDDFLFGSPSDSDPEASITHFLELCATLGIQIARDKITRGVTTCIYLGVEIDTVRQEARLPADKLIALGQYLSTWLHKSKATLHDLQQLGGKLAWSSAVVPPGRTYTQHIYALMSKLRHRHHHIRIPAAVRDDIGAWLYFLQHWNGTSMLTRRPLQHTVATDASSLIGGGGYHEQSGRWFFIRWDTHHTSLATDRDLHITWKELYCVVVAAATFGHAWRGHSVTILCDNTGAVGAITSRSTRQPDMLQLIRLLIHIEAELDIHIHAQYIPGPQNTIADHISRARVMDARPLTYLLDEPCALPPVIESFESQLQSKFYASILPRPRR